MYARATAIAVATAGLGRRLPRASARRFEPSSGPTQLIFAFEAVVIGGIGSLWGTLVGGIVLGVAQAIGAQIDPQYSILAGHLVFLAVLASPRGGILAGAEPRRERVRAAARRSAVRRLDALSRCSLASASAR